MSEQTATTPEEHRVPEPHGAAEQHRAPEPHGAADERLVAEELLVDEVSIDGMCGVY